MEKRKQPREAPVVAKSITKAMATWSFICCFVFLFLAWAMWNRFGPVPYRFDPYPFILFNLFLSFIAAIQGSVIMIYQKYQDMQRDKMLMRMDRHDTQLVKLEKESNKRMDSMDSKLDLILSRLPEKGAGQ